MKSKARARNSWKLKKHWVFAIHSSFLTQWPALDEEDNISPLGLTKDHKIQIEVIHPFTIGAANVAMKILID